MAYEALLFCPEEKTARTVTQVLAELEFSVEPCTEPFAAVKKLMSQHFDAIVVDCDNEQNATLLFKSARNSTSNQASLAVAIVEGQAGVAKAFRIGANLVLTKPINVEQSKGTLRVARGLLRKGEPGKPASAPTSTASAAPTTPVPTPAATAVKPLATKPMPAPVKSAAPAAAGVRTAPTPKPATIPPARPPIPAVPAKSIPVPAVETMPSSQGELAPAVVNKPTPIASLSTPTSETVAPKPSFSSTATNSSGTASAPAPAREPQPGISAPASESKVSEIVKAAEPAHVEQPAVLTSDPAAPSFTFGGANTTEPSSGTGKKVVVGLVAAIAIAAFGYFGWNYYQGHGAQSTAHAPSVAITPQSKPAPQSVTPSPAQPDATEPVSQPPSQTAEMSTPSPTEAAPAEGADEKPARPAKNSTKPLAAPTPKNAPAADAVETAAPLVVKSGPEPHVKTPSATPDATAPSMIGMATPASDGALTSIVADQPAAKPVLQAMKISQGVAQGLVIKRVPPEYPRNALLMRLEGAVDLEATISKDGDIKNVKVVKGDPQLSRAAVQAVKQWKYKPYLLNGEPVEIQTNITINFNLPK